MKNESKKIILSIILILAVFLGVIAYAYFKTDVFKTPDQLFKKYLANNVEQLESFNFKPFDEVFKKMEKESSEFNLDITTKNVASLEDGEMKINLKTKSDVPNKKSAVILDVKADDEYLLGFDTLIANQKIGFHMSELHDKYLTIENRELKKLAKTLGMDEDMIAEIPDQIPEVTDYTEEDIKKYEALQEKYVNRIFEQISEDKYSIEKKVQTEINGENVNANKYTVTLTNKSLGTIFTTTLKELLEEPDFVSLCNQENNEQLENLKKQNDELRKEIDAITEEKEMKISVYEANKKTIKTEVLVDQNVVTFNIENKENESVLKIAAKTAKTDVNEVAQEAIITISNNYANNSGELVLGVKNTYNKDDIKVLKSSEESEYYDETYYDEKYKDSEVKVKLITTQNDNVTTSKIDFEGDGTEEIKDMFKSEFRIKFDSNITVGDLNEENTIVLNDYTEEDLSNLIIEIGTNLQKSLQENPNSLISAFIMESIHGNSSSVLENDDDTNSPTITGVNPDIESKKADVETDVYFAISELLQEYHDAAIENPDENPGNYLTVDKIKSKCEEDMELDIIDGSTLKCTLEDNVFFVKIDINGEDWTLNDVEALYSEDGTLENAE